MAKVAFLGLGVMGFPMAGHLAAKGHDVTVYNRTFAKAEAWTQKHKGKAAKTPKPIKVRAPKPVVKTPIAVEEKPVVKPEIDQAPSDRRSRFQKAKEKK
jgi:glutamyl-tRNA reductase